MNKLKSLVHDVLSLQLLEVLIISSPLYLSCLWSGLISLILPYSFLTILGIYWILAIIILCPIIFYMKKTDGENWDMNGSGFLAGLFLFAFFPFSLIFMGFNCLKEYLQSQKSNL